MKRDSRKRGKDLHWIPEKNMIHGFTFKGFLILIILFIVGSLINYLFFKT